MAREIEQTRAELTAAIDAIAQRVSPKRVASRGAEIMKSQTGRYVAIGGAVVVIALFFKRRRSR
jgi:Protein of unknown function (DUF3618)